MGDRVSERQEWGNEKTEEKKENKENREKEEAGRMTKSLKGANHIQVTNFVLFLF